MNPVQIALLSSVFVLAVPGAASAADFFLKFNGIDGESTDQQHERWIELESWSFGVSNSGSIGSATGGAGAGRAVFAPFVIRKRIDKASPVLLQAAANGRHFTDVTLSCMKTRGGRREEYLVVKLSDVMISSFQTGDAGGDVLPTESIAISFARVEYRIPGVEGAAGTVTTETGGNVRFDAIRPELRIDAVTR